MVLKVIDFCNRLLFLLAVELKFGSETEIGDFEFHFIVKEEISELETSHKRVKGALLSMDDTVGVEVFKCVDNLDNVALDLEFVETFSSL
jgi:hypothetical protein